MPDCQIWLNPIIFFQNRCFNWKIMLVRDSWSDSKITIRFDSIITFKINQSLQITPSSNNYRINYRWLSYWYYSKNHFTESYKSIFNISRSESRFQRQNILNAYLKMSAHSESFSQVLWYVATVMLVRVTCLRYWWRIIVLMTFFLMLVTFSASPTTSKNCHQSTSKNCHQQNSFPTSMKSN